MKEFAIYPLPVANGEIALSSVPGRSGSFDADMQAVLDWGPEIVFTMTTLGELDHVGASELPTQLSENGITWVHLPIADFGTPNAEINQQWKAASDMAHRALAAGKRILIHCYGGCGRSGMAALRLMIETGEDPQTAFDRLRQARPCAVETDAQRLWAFIQS